MQLNQIKQFFVKSAVPVLRRRPSWKFSLFMVLAQKTAHYSTRGTADSQARRDSFFLDLICGRLPFVASMHGNFIYVHYNALRQF